MHRHILETERCSRRSNILGHNVPEKSNENVENEVISSLDKHVISKENYNIDIAHTKGPPRKLGSKPCRIVAKMERNSESQHILYANKFGKGAKPTPATLHVTPQMPEELREPRKKFQSLANM